jgi:hypothetical protein
MTVQRGNAAAACNQSGTLSGCTSFTTGAGNATVTSIMTVDPSVSDSSMEQLGAHEVGHSYGIKDCDGCAGTVMNEDITSSSPTGPTPCDTQEVFTNSGGSYGYGGGGGSGGGCVLQSCGSSEFCPGSACGNGGTLSCCDDSGGDHPCCSNGSPIIVDTAGEGFHLTGLAGGVRFRNTPDEAEIQMSWTDARFHNAWLALDRNGNGTIDSLSELFGNFTPQPKSSNPNGFLALSVFDEPRNGGNGNGMLDPGDSVYGQLRLWVDKNQDGISQPDELFTLPEAGLFAIDLHYFEDPKVDEYGNRFRYRSWIVDDERKADPRCYDVFLLEELQ